MPIQIYGKFYHQNENFQTKNSIFFFHISVQNIDCGYSLETPLRGGSSEYPQSMVLSRNKKTNVYPYKSQFYYMKVGFKRVKIILACFRDESNQNRLKDSKGNKISALWWSMGIYFTPQIVAKEIFFHTVRMGTHVNMKRSIPVHILFRSLTEEQRVNLITIYCLTGYSTCSAFFGIGKKSVFNLWYRMHWSFRDWKILVVGLFRSVKKLPALSLLELCMENQTIHPSLRYVVQMQQKCSNKKRFLQQVTVFVCIFCIANIRLWFGPVEEIDICASPPFDYGYGMSLLCTEWVNYTPSLLLRIYRQSRM